MERLVHANNQSPVLHIKKALAFDRQLHNKQSYTMRRSMAHRILHALLTYSRAAEADIARRERDLQKLFPEQKALMPPQEAKLAALRGAVRRNQEFLRNIALSFQEPSLVPGASTAPVWAVDIYKTP